jgi:hypothetical protein
MPAIPNLTVYFKKLVGGLKMDVAAPRSNTGNDQG